MYLQDRSSSELQNHCLLAISTSVSLSDKTFQTVFPFRLSQPPNLPSHLMLALPFFFITLGVTLAASFCHTQHQISQEILFIVPWKYIHNLNTSQYLHYGIPGSRQHHFFLELFQLLFLSFCLCPPTVCFLTHELLWSFKNINEIISLFSKFSASFFISFRDPAKICKMAKWAVYNFTSSTFCYLCRLCFALATLTSLMFLKHHKARSSCRASFK